MNLDPGFHVLPSILMPLIVSFSHLLVFASGCRLVVGCRRFVVPCLLGFVGSDGYLRRQRGLVLRWWYLGPGLFTPVVEKITLVRRHHAEISNYGN